MKLGEQDASTRLAAAHHGVLCTVHPVRGVDAVPVVFALADRRLAIPVDNVKPKTSTRLQRERNLEADPRAALLVEHWDPDDWTRLWWVRAELRHEPNPEASLTVSLARRLAARHSQYRDQPFAKLLVLRIAGVTGWSARPGTG